MRWLKKFRGGLALLAIIGATVGACLVPAAASAAYNGQELDVFSSGGAGCPTSDTVSGLNQYGSYVSHRFAIGCGWTPLNGWWWWGTVKVVENLPPYTLTYYFNVPRNTGSPAPYIYEYIA